MANYINPNVAYLHRQKALNSRDSTSSAAALGRETRRRAQVESLGPNGARLGQDFTYGEVRLDLSEPVRSHI
jgi:hypothetical protein